MKKYHIKSFLMTILLYSSIVTYAQLTIEGEFRPRFELRNGYKQLPNDTSLAAIQISQRSRINFNYSNSGIKTKLSFQDIRIWGDEKLKIDLPSTAVHEAWVEIKLSDSISLRMGRQEIFYNIDRLLSNNNWNHQGTSHDAAVLKYKYNGWRVDLGAAFNQVKDTLFSTDYSSAAIKDNYKTLNYIWINKSIKQFDLTVLGIMDGFQKEGTANTIYMRGTYGMMLNYKINDLSITGRGFMQTGTTSKGSEINPAFKGKKMGINAYYANADISYILNKRVIVIAGFEYLSGQDNKDLENYNSFNTLYGTGHRFNGNMDYFTSFPKDMKNAGLLNPYLKIKYNINEKVSLMADLHYFGLANNYYYSSGVQKMTSNKYLGTEGDLSCNIDFSKEVNLLFGYSFMVADNAMENIVKGDRDILGNWAFAMLTVKPTFFKAEKK